MGNTWKSPNAYNSNELDPILGSGSWLQFWNLLLGVSSASSTPSLIWPQFPHFLPPPPAQISVRSAPHSGCSHRKWELGWTLGVNEDLGNSSEVRSASRGCSPDQSCDSLLLFLLLWSPSVLVPSFCCLILSNLPEFSFGNIHHVPEWPHRFSILCPHPSPQISLRLFVY